MDDRVSFDLTGKQALVTGGRRGIGLAIARALRDHGAEVIITGIREGGQTEQGFPFRHMDLGDYESIKTLAADFDGLDILVNNAGALVREEGEYDPPIFDRIVDTNLNGTYRVCHAFFPHLKARRGCIVNLVSVAAFVASPLCPAYGAAKAGTVELTRTLARRWGREGIRVNAIAPGWIRTDMNTTIQQDAKEVTRIADTSALGRWGLPHEIAGAAVYLASSASSYATGGCVVIDGGSMA